MLATSGANFGFRASLPHIFGVSAGFTSLVIAAGFGLAGLFSIFPNLYSILKFISFFFLIYLALKIGTAGRAQANHHDHLKGFWQAAMFQLDNPKGISVIVSSVTAFTSSATSVANEVFVLFFVFLFVTIGATCTWTLFGMIIGQILNTENKLRLFNCAMAILLIASLLPVILN